MTGDVYAMFVLFWPAMLSNNNNNKKTQLGKNEMCLVEKSDSVMLHKTDYFHNCVCVCVVACVCN